MFFWGKLVKKFRKLGIDFFGKENLDRKELFLVINVVINIQNLLVFY